MIKIRVTTNFPELPLCRQTPEDKCVWGDYEFFVNQGIDECDYWVVFEGLNEKEKANCKVGGTILVTGEPSAVKRYSQDFLDQFDYIVTSQKNINHGGIIHNQQSLPWFVGWEYDLEKKKWLEDYSKGYDELKSMQSIEKMKLVSVVCSDKVRTQGQRNRLRFLKELKKQLGDKIDFFGKGFRPIPDKWDAIASYKYHICMENTATDDYWTEKISDAFLGLAYPIYWGCTNIDDYFPEDSYSHIDINDPDDAINRVKEILDSNIYEDSLDDVKEAKGLVLDKYNFFPHVVDLIENRIETKEIKNTYHLHPENIGLFSIFIRILKSKAWRAYTNLFNSI